MWVQTLGELAEIPAVGRNYHTDVFRSQNVVHVLVEMTNAPNAMRELKKLKTNRNYVSYLIIHTVYQGNKLFYLDFLWDLRD